MAFANAFLGFGMFNCPKTFVVYLSIASDIKLDSLIVMIK